MPQRRVLVADDDPNIRFTLSTLLDDMGFAVETATNGWEAVYAVRRDHPGGQVWLALLDYQMPGMDGLEALHDIHDEAPGVHLAMITANGTVATAVDAMKGGAVDFLAKPFTLAEIRRLVHDLERRDAATAA